MLAPLSSLHCPSPESCWRRPSPTVVTWSSWHGSRWIEPLTSQLSQQAIPVYISCVEENVRNHSYFHIWSILLTSWIKTLALSRLSSETKYSWVNGEGCSYYWRLTAENYTLANFPVVTTMDLVISISLNYSQQYNNTTTTALRKRKLSTYQKGRRKQFSKKIYLNYNKKVDS